MTASAILPSVKRFRHPFLMAWMRACWCSLIQRLMAIRLLLSLGRRLTIPSVLGAAPAPFRGHSAMQNSSPDDCAWFLEFNTPFIKEQRKKLGVEVVAWSKGVEGDCLKPIVISGPSGVGKGTLISRLMKEFPSTFGFSNAMEKDITDGKFLEHASVHGNLYGTSIKAVEAVMDEGKASSIEAIFIFICPPSFEELEKRLRSRGTESEEQIQKRLRNARAELEEGKTSGIFDHLLVNDEFESCYADFKKLLCLEGLNAKKIEEITSHSASKEDGKILIYCGATEAGKRPSSIGGAPGPTTGMKIRPTVAPGVKEL
ncbi:unnamed protein product [Spirodela intermedia]|uniref:Guanylate kinase-like domain-containing protein n=1 Tax=Spirodela intermedia TaxID=51605 RepID=A0A7I8IMR5_SPIIN|nr:unnamed protein product [Spirodela intermedia]CAA6659136.1 unnamed protein product [Spirodela intermedia]